MSERSTSELRPAQMEQIQERFSKTELCLLIVYSKKKETNVLFNDVLNTFTVVWRQTYGKGLLK